jgi:peptidase M24-like protein
MSLQNYSEMILPLRQQMALRNRWLRERLENVVPMLMEREGIDMWLIICREYNEDPVVMTLLPAPAMSARRRTILVFSRQDDGRVQRLSIDRYGHGDFYQGLWNPQKEEQWACLARIVKEHDPQKIATNFSETFAFADGLSHSEAELMNQALGEMMSRCIGAENLVVGWLETRTESELAAYPSLIEMGHALIAQAFSTQVIHPGVTTTDDVIWWMRQKMHEMGLEAWFQPDCEIQALGQSAHFLKEPQRKLIMPGDLLWCDVGFYYLGLATDQQQHAYVLKAGETDAPQGLLDALHEANRVQEIHMQQMKIGRTGNEVLKKVLDEANNLNINAQVYSHPLGLHGHAAGPTIGLWDKQDGVSGRGDYPVYDNTVYSIELNIRKEIPEWDGQEIRIAVEEDAVMSGGEMRWLDRHQTEFHLIG